MRAVLSLFALLAPAQDDVDAAIRQFKKEWTKAEFNDEKREALLAGVPNSQDARFVAMLCDAYDGETSANRVRAKIAQALGNFPASYEAASKLAVIIKENSKPDEAQRQILVAAFAGMSRLSVAVSRKKEYVETVAAYLSSRDDLVALTAVRCLAFMRSPDAVDPLLHEMQRNQKRMRALLGEGADNCDGG